MRYRFETFGGIVSSEQPPFLAFVDRQFMRELGLGESPLWSGASEEIGLLSAPTEVHLAATTSCPHRCRHCYMDGGSPASGEMDTGAIEHALALLADMGVFHVALGGGEALARQDIFDLAHHARRLGMVPNLTISGALMSPETASRMTVFGQVNVSMDGVGPAGAAYREHGLLPRADEAMDLLLDAGVPSGINCVLGRRNFDGIPELFAHAARKGANEIELLRLKPAGRGGPVYEQERCTHEQNVALVPMLARLSEEHGIRAKIDCSFVPMMCHHSPPRELLFAMATYGCEAANVLLGVGSDGRVSGCSFLPPTDISLDELAASWSTAPQLTSLREWSKGAPEPCASCDYLDICKGGCRAVAAYTCGDIFAADPDCPRVVEHLRQERR